MGFQRDLTAHDQRLQAGARQRRQRAGQDPVQPIAVRARRGGDAVTAAVPAGIGGAVRMVFHLGE